MFLLNNNLVENYVERDQIKIENFELKNLYSTFYYFRLGNSAKIWNENKQEYDFIELNSSNNETLKLPAKSYALIKSYERFTFTPQIVGLIGQISALPLAGLKLNNSPTIDPLFEGYLEMGIENILNVEVEISAGSDIGKILFFDIGDTPPLTKNVEEKTKNKFKSREKLEQTGAMKDFRLRFKSNKQFDI